MGVVVLPNPELLLKSAGLELGIFSIEVPGLGCDCLLLPELVLIPSARSCELLRDGYRGVLAKSFSSTGGAVGLMSSSELVALNPVIHVLSLSPYALYRAYTNATLNMMTIHTIKTVDPSNNPSSHTSDWTVGSGSISIGTTGGSTLG